MFTVNVLGAADGLNSNCTKHAYSVAPGHLRPEFILFALTVNVVKPGSTRGMWCLRHAGALAWRRGPVCACTRVCWCRQIFACIHTLVTAGHHEPEFVLFSRRARCGGWVKLQIYTSRLLSSCRAPSIRIHMFTDGSYTKRTVNVIGAADGLHLKHTHHAYE